MYVCTFFPPYLIRVVHQLRYSIPIVWSKHQTYKLRNVHAFVPQWMCRFGYGLKEEIRGKNPRGIKIGRIKVQMICFADNIADIRYKEKSDILKKLVIH